MRYTYDNGIDRTDEPQRKLLVSIPVVAGLLLLMGLAVKHNPSPAPVTVGKPHLIAVKHIGFDTPSVSASSATSSGLGGQGGAGGTETSLAASSGNLQPASGGVGGGSVSPAPSPSPSPSGGMGGGSGVTVVCDNSSGAVPITCQACVPPLVVPVGQKAIISTTPGCILAN